jgi:hypothetical protein
VALDSPPPEAGFDSPPPDSFFAPCL